MELLTLAAYRPPCPPSAVALGTFDGVHRGHQALLTATARAAEAENLIPCAYTFDVPPAAALGRTPYRLLTDLREKAALMGKCGIERVIYSHFDERVAAQEAEAFFRDLLLGRLNARHIVIGFHYHFGQFARGDAALTTRFCREEGIALTVVPPVCLPDGTLVSSSAVRDCLFHNDRRRAEEMLNRPLSPREEGLLGGRNDE